MVEALIWDAGGTIFDTYPAVVAACQTVLESLGHDASSDWLTGLFRTTTAYALRTVALTYGVPVEEFATLYEAAYDRVDPALQPPFPHVVDVCGCIAEAGGRSFIVTHRGEASLVRLLEAHGMTQYFGDWITAEDQLPRKPDPTSLQVLMARHKLVASRCLVIGDRDLDIVAGRRAGVLTCYFGAESHPTQADFEIAGYDELLRWLGCDPPGTRDSRI